MNVVTAFKVGCACFSLLLVGGEMPAKAKEKTKSRVLVRDGSNSPNDLEGAVWQYKVLTGKKEELKSGSFRIDGAAIYPASTRLVKIKSSTRVGDVVKDKKSQEVQLRFTDFEDLKGGRAVISYNKEIEGGVWIGYFLDAEKKRYRFELRKAED